MIDGVNDAFDGLKVNTMTDRRTNFVVSASFLMEHEIITQMRDNDREKWQVHQNFIVVISTFSTFPFLHMYKHVGAADGEYLPMYFRSSSISVCKQLQWCF